VNIPTQPVCGVSVIIPTYRGADFLGQAIQSVLAQTYQDLELLVIDDASPDNTAQIVQAFNDPRIRYIRHAQNRGAVAARQTGVAASSGSIIAFLDQDDLFHPEKLQVHQAFLSSHPAIGATYNARLEIRDHSKKICGLWQPPKQIDLADLVVGFPIAPSDLVVRRDWVLRPEIWDISIRQPGGRTIFNGQEIIFGGRLFLAGCQFASVGRALNFRRFHTNRVYADMAAKCDAEIACQEMIFSDTRCPPEVAALRDVAASNFLLYWSLFAFAQQDAKQAQAFLASALRRNPALTAPQPGELLPYFASAAADRGEDIETFLRFVFSHLPGELQWLAAQADYAIGWSYLLRGLKAVMWDDAGLAETNLAQARTYHACLDNALLQALTSRLMDYELEFGPKATQTVIERLEQRLGPFGGKKSVRRLRGNYWVKKAFDSYNDRKTRAVPASVLRGVVNEPGYLANRGILSIFVRSMREFAP